MSWNESKFERLGSQSTAKDGSLIQDGELVLLLKLKSTQNAGEKEIQLHLGQGLAETPPLARAKGHYFWTGSEASILGDESETCPLDLNTPKGVTSLTWSDQTCPDQESVGDLS